MTVRGAWLARMTPPLLLLLLCLTLGLLVEAQVHDGARRGLTRTASRPLIAYLVLRAEDCEAHLELLRTLQRPSIARTTQAGGAILIGSMRAARPAMALIARELPGLPARRASLPERRLFWKEGYRRTPVFLVLDASSGAVRFASVVPFTPRERVRFLVALTAVTAF